MPLIVYNNDGLPYSKSKVGEAETLAEAKAMIPGEIILIEEDAEYPGYFDAFNSFGSVYLIEPAEA